MTFPFLSPLPLPPTPRFTSATSNFSSAERLKTVIVATEQIVAKMKCLIKEDARIIENEIKDNLNLASGSLNGILHHHLGV